MNQVGPRLYATDQWVRSARIACRSVRSINRIWRDTGPARRRGRQLRMTACELIDRAGQAEMCAHGYPVFSANRSPAEDVEAHAVGEDRSGPRSVMARQRLIDNVKEALGNVASQTRAVSGRAAKAVGWQAPKKGGATKAAAGNRSAAKRTSQAGCRRRGRHARRPDNRRKEDDRQAAGRAKTAAQKATAATPGARKTAAKKTTAKTPSRAKTPAQKTAAKAVAKKAPAKKPNQK